MTGRNLQPGTIAKVHVVEHQEHWHLGDPTLEVRRRREVQTMHLTGDGIHGPGLVTRDGPGGRL